MPLEFPFVEVTDLELAFPIVPNYDEVIAAVPDEFSPDQQLFLSAAQKWFDRTFNVANDLPGYRVRTRDVDEAIQQRNYIEVWSGTYQPRHEQKIQVMGWLLSLAFEMSE